MYCPAVACRSAHVLTALRVSSGQQADSSQWSCVYEHAYAVSGMSVRRLCSHTPGSIATRRMLRS